MRARRARRSEARAPPEAPARPSARTACAASPRSPKAVRRARCARGRAWIPWSSRIAVVAARLIGAFDRQEQVLERTPLGHDGRALAPEGPHLRDDDHPD